MPQINYRLLFYPEPAGDPADTGRGVSSALQHGAPAPSAEPVPVDEVVDAAQAAVGRPAKPGLLARLLGRG